MSLILAESSLETIPASLQKDKSIQQYCRRFGKKPQETLLDISWHYSSMKDRIKQYYKRGRPDIVHLCLLQACSIPLYDEGKLQVYLHTANDQVISVGPSVRPPRSYHRFAGLMESLFVNGIIKSGKKELLRLQNMTFKEFVFALNPDRIIGLSKNGTLKSCKRLAEEFGHYEKPCVVIGGFPRGTFSKRVRETLDDMVAIHDKSLDANVVTSRILYEYEKQILSND